MSYIAHIRDNFSGEIVQQEWEDVVERKTTIFFWSEGNASCDCFRMLEFERTKGRNPEEDIECSEYLYSVNLQDAETKEYFYKEFEMETMKCSKCGVIDEYVYDMMGMGTESSETTYTFIRCTKCGHSSKYSTEHFDKEAKFGQSVSLYQIDATSNPSIRTF